MESKGDLTIMGRKKVAEGLFSLLADTYAVYLQTQNCHWNLQGSYFYSLHKLLESQYEELAEAIDEIAERIRALGFFIDASFVGFQKKISIAEGDDPKKKIPVLIQGHESIVSFARTLSQVAEKEGDFATVDLMGRRLNVHEKFVWMLKSQIVF